MNFDIAARRAELSPGRNAVWFAGRWYDYFELNQRAARLAGRLAQAGVGMGDRVAILAHNHLAHIDLILATAKVGFAYTPFNHRLSEAEQARLAQYVRPSLFLHDDANSAAAREAARASGSPLQSLDSYEAWLENAPPPPSAPQLDAEDTQMILFTGGTTGLPKGAMLPYRQGFYNAVNTVMSWGLRDDDCVVQATPCFHAAVNAFTVPLLHLGARVVLQRSFEPGEYLRLIGQQGATILFLVPTMYGMLTQHPDFADADLSTVRWAISGGAPCPDRIRGAFEERGVRFKQGYGLTEAGVNCFAMELSEARQRPLSVGKPMLHASGAIRHEDGSPVTPGEVGELTLAGPHLFKGYFERPEETAQVLRDGWLWTGDLARQDEGGFYYLVGRRKEMFISGGENIYPTEIENALHSHPSVAECTVVGVPDERWGEIGVAAVVLRQSEITAAGDYYPESGGEARSDAAKEEELKEFLRGRLARYKVPKKFVFLEELPKSGAGKVLKREIARSVAESTA